MLTGPVANVSVAGLIELSMGAGAGVMRNSVAFENVLLSADTSIIAVPAVAIDAAGTVAVNCVGLISAVVRACAFHRTVAPAKKLEPVTVSVNDGPPAVTEAGDRAVIAGVPVTVRVRLFDVGNPGRDTDTASEPVLAINAAGMFTRISPASTRIDGKFDPATFTVVPLTNPAPDIARVNEGPPTSTAVGLSVSMRKAGVTVKISALETVAVGLLTLTGMVPSFAIRSAVTGAVIMVGVTRLALRTVLPKFTVEPATKPLPAMASVNPASPTLARVGVIELIEYFSMASERLLDGAPSAVATVIATNPGEAISEGGICAVNWVVLT